MTFCLLIFILVCIESTATSEVAVRLVGNNSLPHAGRLEIYYNDTWGTVCGDYFHDTDAQVACHMLGFARLGFYVRNYYGRGSGPIWLDDVNCTGNELSLAECGHYSWGVHNCRHHDDASIVCDNSNCSTSHPGCDAVCNTNVRSLYHRLLQGTYSRYQLQSFCEAWNNCSRNLQLDGCAISDLSIKVLQYSAWRQFRVYRLTQQRYNEVVGSMHHLCSDIETQYEIYRTCYQSDLYNALREGCGYGSYIRCSSLQSRKYCYARKIRENCNTSAADINMLKMIVYGTQVMQIVESFCAINFDQLIGNKSDLSEIINSMPIAKVRLAGDDSLLHAGRLEIYYNKEWGTVCSDYFDDLDAHVACYMLGFGRFGLSIRSYYGSGSGPIWLDDLDCTGNELSLAECGHHGWGVHNCGHYRDAYIVCDNSNCSTGHSSCDAVWNTDVRRVYHGLLQGTYSRYQLQSFCGAWSNCSENLQLDGCAINDLSIKVLQYSAWRQFKNYYHVQQQRYNEAVDFLHHLCSDIVPHDEIYRPCYQSDLYNALREGCGYTSNSGRSCSFLQSRKYCYARKIQENCNTSAADTNILKMIIYGTQVMQTVESSCALNIDQLIGNKSDVSEIVNSIPTVKVRLAGYNRPPNVGRLEIYYNDTWGTVCDNGFDDRDAQVACYMLGYGRYGAFIHQIYGSGSGPIWLDAVYCTGNELSLAECGHDIWGVHDCDHYEDVSITCERCSTSHPGCDAVWNANVPLLYRQLMNGTLRKNELVTFCTGWNICSANLQREGCSFYDLPTKMQRNWPSWRFSDYELSRRRYMYNETVDSADHLCGNVYPHYEVYQQCFRGAAHEDVRQQCNGILTEHTAFPSYYNSDCKLMPILTSCYTKFLEQFCNITVTDQHLAITMLYHNRLNQYNKHQHSFSCDMYVKELIDNATVDVHDCDVNSYFFCYAQWQTGFPLPSSDIQYAQSTCQQSPATLQTTCDSWNSFASCINTTGCTFEDIYKYRLTLGNWSRSHQRRYNLSSTTYLFSCSHTYEYQNFYQCCSEESVCDDNDLLKDNYEYENCTQWIQTVACKYNSIESDCDLLTANAYLQFQYQSSQAWQTCDFNQLTNASVYEQITTNRNCSEFRYYFCLLRSGLQDILFDDRNISMSLIAYRQRADILPICMQLENMTTCLGCSPADLSFSNSIMQFREYEAERVALLQLHEVCSNKLTPVAHETTSTEVATSGGRTTVRRTTDKPTTSQTTSFAPETKTPLTTTATSRGRTTVRRRTDKPTTSQTTSFAPETTTSLIATTETSEVRTTSRIRMDNRVTFRAISVDNVWPLYGPVAGGTRVTITGQFPFVNTVIAVYFGQNQGFIERTAENSVVVTTPPVNETARHLDIELILDDGSVINTNRKFEYRGNPVFRDISPRNHLTRGGTQVTVSGDNLDSVAELRITLTVVITRFYNETESVSTKTETDSEPCILLEAKANGSQILCLLPAVSLPDELNEDLALNDSAKAENTEGPGVAAYVSSDGRTRADVYVGLKLDGFKRFQNISSVDSSIKIQFSLPPTISCEPLVAFNPNEHKVISIKGQYLQRGSRLVDFDIRLGVAVCVPASLSDNRVDCRPPTKKPNRNINDTFCHGDMLSMQVMIGYAHYQCSCVRYVPQDKTALIVGLSVGLAALLAITVIVINVIVVRRQKGWRVSKAKDTKTTKTQEEAHYSRRLPGNLDESEDRNDPENVQQRKKLDDFARVETRYEEDEQYSKTLPGDYKESRDQDYLSASVERYDMQRSKELTDDVEPDDVYNVEDDEKYSTEFTRL